jgi:hypothetical protein
MEAQGTKDQNKIPLLGKAEPQDGNGGCDFYPSSSGFEMFSLFDLSHSVGYVSLCGSNLHSSNEHVIEDIFMFLFAIHIFKHSTTGKVPLFKSSTHFYNWMFLYTVHKYTTEHVCKYFLPVVCKFS